MRLNGVRLPDFKLDVQTVDHSIAEHRLIERADPLLKTSY